MKIATWLYNALVRSSKHPSDKGTETTATASPGANKIQTILNGPIRVDRIPFPGTTHGLTASVGKPSETINYLMFNSGRNHVTSKLSRYCDYLKDELKKPHSGFIVLRNAQNKIVGTAAVLNKGLDAHIVMVHVAASQRRRGLARWMMQTLIEHAQERGFENVTLNVRNPNAITLYQSLGFEATGQTDLIDGKRYLYMKRPCRPSTFTAIAPPTIPSNTATRESLAV